MQFIELFDKSVSAAPDRPFLVMADDIVTYREAASVSRKIANVLREMGLHSGDKAIVFSENTIAACLAILGILRAGCVWVTGDASGESDSIAFNLHRLGINIVFYSRKYEAKVKAIKSLPAMVQCLDLGGGGKDALDKYIIDTSDSHPNGIVAVDDIATLFASGGSTGEPRNAVATHKSWQIGLANLLAIAPDDGLVNGVVTPLTHIGGGTALLFTMARAGTVVLIEQFDPEYIGYLVAKHRISFLFVPPTALRMMLSDPGIRRYDFSSMKTLIYSGAPSQVSTIVEALEVFGPVLATSYGQTETTVPVAALLQKDHAAAIADGQESRLSSCGRALPMSRIEIMDESGLLVDRGQVGEIVVRAGHLMTGYYRDPTETAEVSKFGWHHTGDVGFLDDYGYLYIIDRKREMIITGGHKVFPRQIEEVIEAHPAIRECVVVGAPHDVLGEIVKAIVVLKVSERISAVALKAYCMSKLGAIRSPASIEFWEDLPRSSAGKVARGLVREKYWKLKDRPI